MHQIFPRDDLENEPQQQQDRDLGSDLQQRGDRSQNTPSGLVLMQH